MPRHKEQLIINYRKTTIANHSFQRVGRQQPFIEIDHSLTIGKRNLSRADAVAVGKSFLETGSTLLAMHTLNYQFNLHDTKVTKNKRTNCPTRQNNVPQSPIEEARNRNNRQTELEKTAEQRKFA